MIYFVGVCAAVIVLIALAYRGTLVSLSRIVKDSSADGPVPTISSWLLMVPFFGKKTHDIALHISKVKQSELDHKNRYRILTENVAASVMLHESDGTIVWCSPFTEVLTGFPLSEIYRDKENFLRSHVHDEDKESVERALKIVSTGEPFQCRYRFYHKSGLALWLETRTVPILDNGSNDYVALSVTIDVTAQVMNQMQIEERNRDLNEFTYMISHDLKAPILTISGMLGILEEEDLVKANSTVSEPLSYIRKATRRLQDLVTGVIELAKISAAERSLEPIKLEDVIHEVLEDHRLQIEKCAARITTVNELPVVLGNRTQLYQVFSNLIGNAIKYQKPDTALMISVEAEKGPSRRRASIVVSDNGRGIAPDKIDGIFKPFNRAGEEAIEGTGIGLASVKKLIDKLGGSIRVASNEGQGSSFTIELRRAPEQY